MQFSWWVFFLYVVGVLKLVCYFGGACLLLLFIDCVYIIVSLLFGSCFAFCLYVVFLFVVFVIFVVAFRLLLYYCCFCLCVLFVFVCLLTCVIYIVIGFLVAFLNVHIF